MIQVTVRAATSAMQLIQIVTEMGVLLTSTPITLCRWWDWIDFALNFGDGEDALNYTLGV
jgi:hypothetical protein